MEQALILYVANAVWRIPLVAIGAAILTRVGGLGPVGRHRVWLTALALAVTLPALPGAEALRLIQPAPVAPTPLMTTLPMAQTAEAPAATQASLIPPMQMDAEGVRLILAIFGAVAGLSIVRLAMAWRGAVRLVRRSDPLALSPAVAAGLDKSARAWAVASPPVRVSADIRGPVVAGAFSPVILVPRAFARLPEDEQSAALLHELAHVVRRDFALNLACEAASLPACWHPVIYEIKAGVRRSRELACDAMASAATGSRQAYARRLIALARAFGPPEETGSALVGLIGASSLEERLMHLIASKDLPDGARTRLIGASALAAVVLAPAVLLHVAPAFAQTPMPAPRPVPAVAPVAPIVPVATPPAPVKVHDRTRVRLARAETAPRPFAPEPAPAPAPAAQPTPPAPPVPPVPPEPPVNAGQIEAMVDAALAQTDVARQAFVNAHIEAAMAALQARQNDLSSAEGARMMAEVRRGMEAWKNQHLPEEMARVRSEVHQALASAEVRQALASAEAGKALASVEARKALDSEEVRQALRQAARSADEAREALKRNPPD